VTYSGHVDPGGAAAVRELTDLIITKQSVGRMDNNAYLLRCRITGAQLLIDAAAEPKKLLALVGPRDLSTVVTTHQHYDHWYALEDVLDATGAQSLAHALDAGELPQVDQTVDDGQTIRVGEVPLEVVHLVGHTPGSIALLYRDPGGFPHLFTGDSLFPGGVGKTNSPEQFTSLLGDVTAKLFDKLPDETWFYPGHGDDSTLGAERPALDEWRARGW
jgi:glyoxylase-like metal-dependent hydrolase (beta-lactamase superfamily II)